MVPVARQQRTASRSRGMWSESEGEVIRTAVRSVCTPMLFIAPHTPGMLIAVFCPPVWGLHVNTMLLCRVFTPDRRQVTPHLLNPPLPLPSSSLGFQNRADQAVSALSSMVCDQSSRGPPGVCLSVGLALIAARDRRRVKRCRR